MKGEKREIKVSDLLHQLGSDSLSFDHVFLNEFDLTEEGISGTVELYSMDEESVFVKLIGVHAVVKSVCDLCQKDYEREINIEEYAAKYTLNKEDFDESDEEVVLMIDPKKETIDLSEMLYQAIMFQTPFVLKCPECAMIENAIDEEEED